MFMFARLCDNCCIFRFGEVMPSKLGATSTGSSTQQDAFNKRDHFTNKDGDRQTEFESIFMIISQTNWHEVDVLIYFYQATRTG